MLILKYHEHVLMSSLNWISFTNIHKTSPYFLYNMAIELKKKISNRSFGITMRHFIKQNSSLCSLHEKLGIQINYTVYTSNVYYMIFFRNFFN